MDNDSSYVLSGSSSVNTNATVHLNISEKGNTSITSQIFDINHFQDILNTAHVCYGGGRLEFVPDVLPCSGLFHHNILRCTKCGNETPLTNFPVIHPIKTTQQEPNKRLTLAAATTGVGYRATKSIMSTLSLSIQSERTFLKQLHKFYDDISLINGLRYKHMVCDGDASAYEAIKYYYVRHQQQQRQHTSLEKGTEDEELESEGEESEPEGEESESEGEESESEGEESESEGEESESEGEESESEGEESESEGEGEESESEGEGEESEGEGEESESEGEEYESEGEESKGGDMLNREKTRQISVTKSSFTSSNTNKNVAARQLLADNKPWGGGAGRMTNQMMKKLSNNYALAIREGSRLSSSKKISDALCIMRRHCCAAFYHYLKTTDDNEEEQHKYCPKTSNTWCFYHKIKSQSNNNNCSIKKQKKNQSYLDPIFREVLEPMILKLTAKQLLRRCLRGITQNSNESLNSVVWSILTKSKHHGFRAVRGSAALAAMYFNSGSSILIDYFKQHGIKTSEILLKHLFEKDKKRIINFKNNNEQRQNRIKKKASDRQNSIKAASDVVDYNPGGFNY
ncbi:unnamed protein product [Rotaria sordida]|uniref:Mutator-like transposase domain-containing protein n=1 Tax=Rotaria sordida TaxID=392033 RepID=A0A819FS64_9BILA|nr:unnamed protein product [Rotaria sordida]